MKVRKKWGKGRKTGLNLFIQMDRNHGGEVKRIYQVSPMVAMWVSALDSVWWRKALCGPEVKVMDWRGNR